jgi:deoxyadenosine/deoxycytidine kinase
MYIAVSGNIASGKTTLTEKLAKHYGWTPLFETVVKNPYLEDFYNNMSKWAFHMQVYFLNSRFKRVHLMREIPGTTVQDRTIYEDASVFAKNLHQLGMIDKRDYHNYLGLYNSMIHHVKPPDLLIYLKADVPKLISQIQQRGRKFENRIEEEYLNNLNMLYQQWIETYDLGKLLIVDVNQFDFVSSMDDFPALVKLIEHKLPG